MPGDTHVIVLEKNHVAGNIGARGEPLPFAEQRLACAIGGVRLAGNQQLHRVIAMGEEARQPFRVLQQQVGAFVGGEAPGKAQRQPLRMQARAGEFDLRRRGAVHREAAGQVAAYEAEQFATGMLADLPQPAVIDLGQKIVH